MTMTDTPFDRRHIEVVLAEFVEDNPLACAGILSIARLVYTTEIPTLAVSLGDDPPRLLINPEFVAAHLRTEDDLRAVLLHEFLHVLLGHTKLFKKMDAATNFALDAVINHIVQRELGIAAGDFFRRYYTPAGDACPLWLLRPDAPGDIRPRNPAAAAHRSRKLSSPHDLTNLALQIDHRSMIHLLRSGLANGTVLADDVLDTFDALKLVIPGGIILMGNHRKEGPMHPANRERLDRLFHQLDGSGVFRNPGEHGAGPEPYQAAWSAADPSRKWCAETARILQKLLVPHPRSRPMLDGQVSFHLPVANSSDRRAALRSLWNPLVPDFHWHADNHRPRALASIYEDRGLEPALALQVATALHANDPLATHLRDELGFSEHSEAKPLVAAGASALTFAVGAALPLAAAALVPEAQITLWVTTLSLLFLALLGAIGAKAGGAPVLRAVARVTFWGAVAMAVTAAVGALFGAVV